MSEKKTEIHGRPWKDRKYFKAFATADELRNNLLEEGEFQAKVKCIGEYPTYQFVVRVRETDEHLRELQIQKEKTSKGRKDKNGATKRKEKNSTARQRN